MSEKTIALSGAEVKVTFSGGNAWLRNDGASAVYAAKTAGVAAGADGVISIPAGCSAPVYGANGTVFLLGSGSVQIIGSDYATNPFVGDSFGGGADISTNAAGIVTLDGLQGGVPFSEIVLSGDDIINQTVMLSACGKNLIPYPYSDNRVTREGISFVANADGTISMSGTATQDAYFNLVFNKDILLKKGITYTLSTEIVEGSVEQYAIILQYANVSGAEQFTGAGNIAGNSVTFVPENDIKCRMWLRVNSNKSANCTITAMLEAGNAPTEYAPYSGSVTTVTPDKSPYTVPNDIRQQDGINNVSVSAGEVSVTGVKLNAAVKRIWDKLDELTAAIIVSNGETTE